jgi:mutual gliding-motility protein MglA
VVFFNYTTMQMTAKIVYYGPGLCGKTTNLQAIHQRTAPQTRGEMVSLETETDRTLFFDLLPLEVGIIGGMKVRLQLYTVPGQVFYNATRKLVLKGVDGVVFVADSQAAMLDANIESVNNLRANLVELGMSIEQTPVIFQYNKRDIRNILPVDELQESLNPTRWPHFEAAALHGVGVFETLKAISRLAIGSVRQKLSGDERATAAAAAPPPAAAVPSVEFGQEDTGKHVVAVKTKGTLDIQQELEKLRTQSAAAAAAAAKPVPASSGTKELDKRLQDLISAADPAARQEIKRKATVDVPTSVLKSAASVTVQLSFQGPEGEPVHEALTIPLGSNRKLERLSLKLDLDVRAKG